MDRLFIAVPVFLLISFALAALLVLAFEVWMLVELVNDPLISSEEKLLWGLGMLFFHPFVAIAYYFIHYSPGRHK